MKGTKKKPRPNFKSEDEERSFWATHDLTDYFETRSGRPQNRDKLILPPRPVTVRLPLELIDFLKTKAERMGMGYQNLIKLWLYERMGQEK